MTCLPYRAKELRVVAAEKRLQPLSLTLSWAAPSRGQDHVRIFPMDRRPRAVVNEVHLQSYCEIWNLDRHPLGRLLETALQATTGFAKAVVARVGNFQSSSQPFWVCAKVEDRTKRTRSTVGVGVDAGPQKMVILAFTFNWKPR